MLDAITPTFQIPLAMKFLMPVDRQCGILISKNKQRSHILLKRFIYDKIHCEVIFSQASKFD